MRSKSWSAICRERVNSYVQQINRGENDACIAWAISNLANSYRPNIFKYRTAKLFRRAIHTSKVHENPKAAQSYKDYVEEIIEIYGFDARYV